MALNPDAPEFLPALSSHIQKGFATMNKTIKLSNNLPVGGAYRQYSSVADFNDVTQRFNHNVIYQLNSIFLSELPSFKLKEDDYEYNMERLIDANDSILDRIYINIECVNKGVEPNQPTDSEVLGPGAYLKPIITTIQVGNTTLTTAKLIPRPQIFFKDIIDNSSALWVPKIVDKPNSIKPLALNMLYNDAGEPIGFEHPYEMELSVFEPQLEWLAPDMEQPVLPLPVDLTNLTVVFTEELLDGLIRHLETVEVMGVDLEHHSYRSYQGFTCLVQITADEEDYLIDAIAVREHLHKLNTIFTNPKKLKIFHGAEMDVKWLQRDFGVYVVGMFDTHKAACALNLDGRSLAGLLKRYCGLDIDKSLQLADWRLRPLTEEMKKYARLDTHYLPYLWRCMRAALLMQNNGNPQMLLNVFRMSRDVCCITYTKQVTDETSHRRFYQRSARIFDTRQKAALSLLYRWRDEAARTLDESAVYVLPNNQLVALAQYLPRDTQGVAALCSPISPYVKQHLEVIHKMILSCREIAIDPRFNMPGIAPACLEAPAADFDVHDLPDDDEDGDYGAQQENNAVGGLELADNGQWQCSSTRPDITLFYTDNVSQNVFPPSYGVQLFRPPYHRQSGYRLLVQRQELREIREKEAAIAAISKGNELIQTELLNKLHVVKAQVEKEQSELNDIRCVAGPSTGAQPNEPIDSGKRNNKGLNKQKYIKNNTNAKTTRKPDERERQNPRPYVYDPLKYGKFRDQGNNKT